MSRTYKDSRGKGSTNSRPKGRGRQTDQLIVRGVRRRPVDVEKLGRALLDLAQAQAETEARAIRTDDPADSAVGEPIGDATQEDTSLEADQ